MSDFLNSRRGAKLIDVDVPRIAAALERIAEQLEKKNKLEEKRVVLEQKRLIKESNPGDFRDNQDSFTDK